MTTPAELPLGELAALICSTLQANGVRATLSGGACAQIYSAGMCVTGDLDFVVNYLVPGKQEREIEAAMTSLGFRRSGRLYECDSITYAVEFPPGPLGIGEQWQIQPVERSFPTGVLSLLSPTDCVKDRLACFFYAGDRQCLRQALLVCQHNDVDLQEVRRWARQERHPEKMSVFEADLARRTP